MAETKTQSPCPESSVCSTRLKVWSLLVSLVLSLIKAVIGIIGKSEALVADGLYSFYQAFICGRSLFSPKDTISDRARLWFVSMVIGVILMLGAFDVFIFSFVNLVKSAKGLLIKPSPYALYAAVISVLAHHILSRYSLCVKDQPMGKYITPIHDSFKLSIIISSVALIGIALSRWSWLGGDSLATIVIVGLMVKPVVGLFYKAPGPLPSVSKVGSV